MHAKLYLKNLMVRENLGDLHIGRKVILKLILKKYDVHMWTRLIWLRIKVSCSLF